MNGFFGENFAPKNFILLGNDTYQLKSVAEQIGAEAAALFPEEFTGSRTMIPFELRYTPPFDKAFNELKRLQSIAAKNSAYKSEYKGYIIIDAAGYVKHENENYFDIALKFLYDMNAFWKYVFIVDSSNAKAAAELVKKILSVIYCKVLDQRNAERSDSASFITRTCEEFEVKIDEEITRMFSDMIDSGRLSKDTVYYVIRELASRADNGCVIDRRAISEYAEDGSVSLRYMVPAERFEKTVSDIKEKIAGGDKENGDDKKEI